MRIASLAGDDQERVNAARLDEDDTCCSDSDSGSYFEQEAARQDPDKAEYGTLMKQYRRMESRKEAGNQAFKANNLEVGVTGGLVVLRVRCAFMRMSGSV